MRSLFAAFRTRNRTRLDGGEAKNSFCGDRHSAIAGETRLERLILSVFGMRVFSVSVGLPDFEQCIWHWDPVAIKDAALNRDPFAGDAFGRQVVAVQPFQTDPEKRPDRLRGCGLQTHRLFLIRRSSFLIPPPASLRARARRYRSDNRAPDPAVSFPSRRLRSAA